PLLSFKSKFSSIWCATPDALGAHQRYLEQIGPRFLAVRVPPLTPQQKHKGYELSRSSDRKALEETFKKAVQDRLRTVLSPAADLVGAVEIPDPVEQWLEKLAEMIAAGRTPLRWEGSGNDRDWRVGTPEEPFRAYQVLRTLLRSLCLVT